MADKNKRITRAERRKLRRMLRANSNAEAKFLNALMLYIKKQTNNWKDKKTFEELQEAITSINFKDLTKLIAILSEAILKKNRKGYEQIVDALIRGAKQRKAQEKERKREQEFKRVVNNLVKEKQLYDPLLKKFEHNLTLIKRFPQDLAEKLKEAYLKGEGFRASDLEKEFTQRLGNRAKRLVRTESAKLNAALTEVRLRSHGVECYIWSATGDSRTRNSHSLMDGVLVFYDNVPTLDKMTGHAGEFPNCFTGDTLVNPSYGIQKLYRRKYSGEFITITLDNGTSITSTPNHPFLSNTGFKAINEFNIGDNLFEIRHDGNISGSFFSQYDDDKNKPTFDEIFAAFDSIGCTRSSITSSASEFHNDGVVNEQVDIIDVDSFLSNNFVSAILQKACKLYFSDARIPSSSSLLPIQCPMLSSTNGVVCSSKCAICRGCKMFKLFRSIHTESGNVSFANSAFSNIIFSKNRLNNLSSSAEHSSKFNNTKTLVILLDYLIRRKFIVERISRNSSCASFPLNDADFFKMFTNSSIVDVDSKSIKNTSRNFLTTFPFLVQPHRIVNKVSSYSDVHVYNLQSDYDYYTINNNICQHNCRCVAEGIFELADINFPIKVAEDIVIESKWNKQKKDYNVKIISGKLQVYNKAQFINKYGDRIKET